MPATNSAIEATKRNRAMMHKPSLFSNMKRLQKRTSNNYKVQNELSFEERKIFERRMSAAKKKGVIKEIKWYTFSTIIGSGFLYMVYQFLF